MIKGKDIQGLGQDLENYRSPGDKDHDGMDDEFERGLQYDLQMPDHASAPRSFWATDFGKTLKAENKLGKTIYTVVPGAIGLLTGINIDPITDLLITQNEGISTMDFLSDFNLWSLFFMIIAAALAYLKSRASNVLDSVYEQAKIGFNLLSEFKKAESEDGKKLSDAEKDQLIRQSLKVFEAIIGVVKPRLFK